MGITNDELFDLLSYDFYQFPGVNMHDGFNMKAPPNHQIETQGSTLSNNRHSELGLSYGSNQTTQNNPTANINQNIATGSANAGRAPVPENNGLGSLPQDDNSSFNPFLDMQQQAYHPTRDVETGTPQFNQASNESSETPADVNHTNTMEQRMSSIDQYLQGNPEPYFPVMDSFGALDGSNQQSGLGGQNSGHEDLMVSDYFTIQHSDSQNRWQPGSSLDSTLVTTQKPHATSAVDLNPQPGVAQSFYPEQEINPVHPNHPNAPQTNNMLLPAQDADLHNQVDQNIRNNNFSNTNHQISTQYQCSFPQNSQAELQVGNVNERRSPIPHQQQAVWPSNAHNIPYRPTGQSGSGDLAAHQLQPLHPPVPMPSNIPNPSSHQVQSSVPPRSSLPLPSRHDQQLNQVPTAAARARSNAITSHLNKSKLLDSSMLSRSSLPSHSRHDQQLNQAPASAARSNAIPSYRNRSLLTDSSKLSRSSLQLPDRHDQRRNKFSAAAPSNAITSQWNKSKLPESSILSRPIRSSDYSQTLHYDPLRAPSWIDYLRPVTLAPKDYVLTGSPPSSGPSLIRNRGSSSKPNSSASQHQNLKERDPSEFERRQKAYDDHSQQHEALLRPTAPGTPPLANTMLKIPLLSGDQQRNSDQQPYKSPFVPDASDFQHGKSMLPEPSMSTRRQDIGQFSPDPNGRSSLAITESPSPLSLEVNSQTDKQKGKRKVLDDSGSPFAFGESLFSSRRDKGKHPMLPPVSISDLLTKGTGFSREKNPQNANPFSPPPRVLKNSAYDPAYEALGIPIDPHLRLFAKNNTLPDCGNKRPRLDES